MATSESLSEARVKLVSNVDNMSGNISILRGAKKLAEELEDQYDGDFSRINYEFSKEAKKRKRGDFLPRYDSNLRHKNSIAFSFNFTEIGGWKDSPDNVLGKIASKYNLDLKYEDDFYILTDREKGRVCEIIRCSVWINPDLLYSEKLFSELAYEAFGAKE
ncbi:MAG: hypothetical protein GWN01_10290 [Nitrosopumilaceae archaeon]|nr:hypothetical protein [Nitrosopumilaceae archaeon]NIU01287.1 hypothetical protein [Nitrosopumilaceae archaeon]NIU87635.1 hypothetical protein [Nitrosopumilaceae archaeon]NIV66060.1 hypothetical protein [Nitrosopumilaceae archaeon]NIX61889.1 hypothetical protein [Nitrosopumilaceae archaeon]